MGALSAVVLVVAVAWLFSLAVPQGNRARQVADAYEFELRTSANGEEVLEVLDAAATGATGAINGSIRCVDKQLMNDGFTSKWEHVGNGGFVRLADFEVNGQTTKGGTNVELEMGTFKYSKGVFFMAPRLTSATPLRKFKQIVLSQLGTAPAATPPEVPS